MSDQLEKEFRALLKSVGKEIDSKVKQAQQLLAEATDLADKHGIPFDSPISEIDQTYVPRSFAERFSALDKDEVEELTDIASYRLTRANGWQHSQVC